MQEAMKSAGLTSPGFEEGANWFKVTLPMESSGEVSSARPDDAIMRLLEKADSISSADVCDALKVSKATAVSYIERLIASGKLVRTGSGPKTRYKVQGW